MDVERSWGILCGFPFFPGLVPSFQSPPSHPCVPSSSLPQVLMHFLSIWQDKFGNDGTNCPSSFCLFHSENKDLLFRSDTKCLAELPNATTYETYLGANYVTALANLRQCSTSSEYEEQHWGICKMNMCGVLGAGYQRRSGLQSPGDDQQTGWNAEGTMQSQHEWKADLHGLIVRGPGLKALR